MTISDRVHGPVEVTDPLLVELIESPALQRLKGVNQYGYMVPWNAGATTNRFDHSVGVMLLLRRFGASLEEQAAGLIHDVSHGTFSHCLDYVLAESGAPDFNQSDNAMETFIRTRTDLPAILERHELALETALDDARHPLKEAPLPDVCADRLDYVGRDAMAYGVLTEADARRFIGALRVEGTHWLFTDADVARDFSERFRRLNHAWWSGLPSASMFKSVSDYLRHALAREYVSVDDLYTTDAEAMAKINAHLADDADLSARWKRMNDARGWKNDPSHPEAKIVCKSRMVDPLVKTETGLARLSELQPDWAGIVASESAPKEWFPVYAG